MSVLDGGSQVYDQLTYIDTIHRYIHTYIHMHTHIHTDRLVDKCMHIGVNWQVSVRKALPKFITLQFQIIVSPLIVWIFCRTPLSYLDPPPPPPPPKKKKTDQKPRDNEMKQEEQNDEYINAFDFLNNF